MTASQHITSCRVYVHPALSSKPQAVAQLQRHRGLILIAPSQRGFATGQRVSTQPSTSPFGGDAA